MTQIIRLQVLRATTAERTSYTPFVGEFILDTDSETLYIGDGSTAGGVLVTPLGGGGETNTASNVGATGIGLFKQKTGVDLEFKNLVAASNKILLTEDVANSEIKFDVVSGNINTSELNNDAGFQNASQVSGAVSSGITAHEALSDPHPQYETSAEAQAKVDAHANLTNNPHSVTASQVGAYTTVQTDTQISTAITTHEVSADPHPQYTTTAEASAAAPVQSVNGETGILTNYAKTNVNNNFSESQVVSDAVGNSSIEVNTPSSNDSLYIARNTGATNPLWAWGNQRSTGNWILANTNGLSSNQRFVVGSNGSVKFSNYGSGANSGTCEYVLCVDSSGNVVEKIPSNVDISIVGVSSIGFSSTTFIDIPGLSTTVTLLATGSVDGFLTYSANRSGFLNSESQWRIQIQGVNGTAFLDTLSVFSDTGAVYFARTGLIAGTYTVSAQCQVDQPITINSGQLRATGVEDS